VGGTWFGACGLPGSVLRLQIDRVRGRRLAGGRLRGADLTSVRWTSVDVVAFHRLVSQRWAEVALVVDDDEGVVLVGDVPAGVEVRCHDDRLVELLTPCRRET